jgi:hypothetical protein
VELEKYFALFSKLAFILLAVWVVLAGLGFTQMPGYVPPKTPRRARGLGGVWAVPVASAPAAEDGLTFPAAPVM